MQIYNKSPKIIKRKKSRQTGSVNTSEQLPSQAQERNIFPTIDENFGFINSILGSGIGLVQGKYRILDDKVQAGIVYIDNITDKKLVSSQIIEPLLKANIDFESGLDGILELIQSKIIYVPDTKVSNQMKDMIDNLLNGSAVLFIEGINNALVMESRKVENRPIEKPSNEAVVLGSLDSLTESLDTNCNLVSKRLPIPNLRFEIFTLGRLSHTKVKLLWIEGIANMNAIEEVRKRIHKIDVDVVDGIGVLSELIEDNPLSLFTTYKQTQRPDVLAKSLSDGQFVVLCNNSPYGFIAPITFWDNFKTMDDYSDKSFVSSYLRFARYLAFVLSITISPLYLAFVAFNHSIVPSALAMNIAEGRAGVPFPSIIEVLILSVGITLIREASLRISGSIGYFIGALAAIVIGQAAVSAGYVSASVIIVVAVSYISAYAISSNTLLLASRLLDYFFIILSGIFGMFGIINGIVIMAWYMVSLESFGVPYLYPLIPFDFEGSKDTFIRAPLSVLKRRMGLLAPLNRVRMKDKDKKKYQGA
jgi:spore germination protein KA